MTLSEIFKILLEDPSKSDKIIAICKLELLTHAPIEANEKIVQCMATQDYSTFLLLLKKYVPNIDEKLKNALESNTIT